MMPRDTPRRRTRAEIARAHRNTTAGIVRDYLTVHFGPDHVITHEVADGRDMFCVRTRADRRPVHTLFVNLLVLEVHEGRLYKLAGLLSYLQVAHHLRTVGRAPLCIDDRCELCEADTGRVRAVPPGRLAVYGREPVARTAQSGGPRWSDSARHHDRKETAMGIASITTRAVGAALGGVLGLASRRRPHSAEWIAECPATETTTAITLDATGLVTGCSYWPERKHCDRSCAGEITDHRSLERLPRE